MLIIHFVNHLVSTNNSYASGSPLDLKAYTRRAWVKVGQPLPARLDSKQGVDGGK